MKVISALMIKKNKALINWALIKPDKAFCIDS